MTINNNSVEQINVALLDMDKKIKSTASKSASASDFKNLEASVDNIKRTLDETKAGLEPGKTYNINISGNAATADKAKEANKLVNALTVNGKTYNGSEAVDAGVQEIENGGTGATDVNGAEFNITAGMKSQTSDFTDTTKITCVQESPSISNGRFFYSSASYLWNYIKDKISSVLGLTSEKVSSYDSHLTNKDNPHSVTKSQVGLDAVVNTGDSATPVSGGTTKFTTGGAYTELNKKVDKVDGKGLSSNDFTDTYKDKLDNIDTTVTTGSSNLVTSGAVSTAISTEVTNRNTAITNAINNLDVNSVGGDGKYISAISETDGKISATSTTMDTAPTTNSVKAVTSGGIKTAISTAETNAKNLENATGTLAIAHGGTGATTAKEAEYNIVVPTQDATLDAEPISDESRWTGTYINPSKTAGRLYTKKFNVVWEYIKGKISSVLGLTATNYSGKAATATSAESANKIVPKYTSKYLTTVTSATTKYIKLADCAWYQTGTLQVLLEGNAIQDTLVINFGGGNALHPMLCGYYTVHDYRVRSVIAQKGSAFNSSYSIYVKINQVTTCTVKVALLNGACTLNITESTTAPTNISEWPVNNGLFGNLTGNVTGTASTAGTADKATNDGNGNNIVNTYALKSNLQYTKSINIMKVDGSSDTMYYLIAKTPGSNDYGNIDSLFVNGSDYMNRMFEGSIRTRAGNYVYNYGKNNLPIELYLQTDGTINIYWLVSDAYNRVALNITATLAITIYGGNLSAATPTGSKMTLTEYDYKSYAVLPVARGGTGQTTANAAADSFINSLPTGTDVPVDDDYYVCQSAGGGTTDTRYCRKPISKLWEYIKGKISSVLGLTKDTYGGKAATAGTADSAKNMYSQTLDLSALDATKFYPAFCLSGRNFAEVALYSIKTDDYASQNRIHFDISTNGWSEVPNSINIREYGCHNNNKILIGCIGRGTQSGGWAIWLRGGLTYRCFTRNCNLSLKTSDYTYGSETYTVGTNYYGGSNTNVGVVFTPQSTITNGAYSSRPITAPSIKATIGFTGNLTGNVSGTASKVANALTINGQSYDGSSALNINIYGAYDHIVHDDASLLEWANCTDGHMKKVLVKSGGYNMTKGVNLSKAGTGYVFAEQGAIIVSKVPVAFTASYEAAVIYNLYVECDGASSSENSCAFSSVNSLTLYNCGATYTNYTAIVNRSLFEKCICYNCNYNYLNLSDSSSISVKVFYQCRCYNCECLYTISTKSDLAISFNSDSYFYKECHCVSCDAKLSTDRNIKAATTTFACYYNCYDRCVGCLSKINVNSKALTVYSTLYGFFRCQYMSSCKETHTEGYSNIKGIVQCDFISSTSGINAASNTHVGNSCSIQ